MKKHLAPLLMLAACAGDQGFEPVDPSLLAANAYEPEKWNDISNEDLARLSHLYGPAIDKIIAPSFEGTDLPATGAERAFHAALIVHSYMQDYLPSQYSALAQALSQWFDLDPSKTATMILDMRNVYKPQGYQLKNNCYAYEANNRVKASRNTPFNAIPGHAAFGPNALKVETRIAANFNAYKNAVIHGAEGDGLLYTGQKQQSRAGFYRVAFFIRPIAHDVQDIRNGLKFHFMRQDRSGLWSQKDGSANVTNLDNSGQPITDPQKADVGRYKFIGYFLVPRGGINTGAPAP
ncbi:MAG: hypothetical protein DI551_01195 [Micavibrio aeruginosavorus]|uniref:Uncharacterized protein n=1 Tax=Micavibrio aeruginosavorus TaxID=349221 RepID=A0A2W5N698_9BACT|nr:MAG: hypothetical protein DI551_01195 [Micavibrio aeruginosavorus]